MTVVYGNMAGVAPHAHKALERIYRRRVPLDRIATPELLRSLAEASRATKRQVGALVHRSGAVEHVILGSATGLMLPDIGRLRAADGRFRALRLIHTHLFGEPLTKDDLVDLTRLRLDLVCAVQLNPEGEPRALTWAYNVPKGDDGEAAHYEVVEPQTLGQPEPNFGELIASLEDEFARRARTRRVRTERAMLIHVGDKKKAGAMSRARSSLSELSSLARTAGVTIVDTVIQLREQIDAKFVLGRGKLDEVVIRAIDRDVDVLIFDRELSPTQSSAIAAGTDLRVIDRSQLILDIFAQRAETRDGKLQVELAQLRYRLPRLGLKDDALSRLTGGIGGRGPGETKLEIGRRRARERVTRLERQLKELAKQRGQRRRRRSEGIEPVIALVGYTNAGKSTLLNALTGAGVRAEDELFATLDPRSRRLRLPSGHFVVVTDTVGFIRDMPRDLFAAFRATFEEAADADLLIHVVDVSHEEAEQQERTTEAVLEELALGDTPRLTLLNKSDLVDHELVGARTSPDVLVVSAASGAGMPELLARIEELVGTRRSVIEEHSEIEEHSAIDERSVTEGNTPAQSATELELAI
ncbi:MAG: GTPase HflX [Polyangiaceae bacterium]